MIDVRDDGEVSDEIHFAGVSAGGAEGAAAKRLLSQKSIDKAAILLGIPAKRRFLGALFRSILSLVILRSGNPVTLILMFFFGAKASAASGG
jgi:hypothetical protein